MARGAFSTGTKPPLAILTRMWLRVQCSSWSAPVEFKSFWHRLTAWPGQGMLYRRYRRGYQAQLPLEETKLRYYMAWAALRRLCRYGMWFRAGSQRTCYKPSSLLRLHSKDLAALTDCFCRQTGLAVGLGEHFLAVRRNRRLLAFK
jgi:hypothetical protein